MLLQVQFKGEQKFVKIIDLTLDNLLNEGKLLICDWKYIVFIYLQVSLITFTITQF